MISVVVLISGRGLNMLAIARAANDSALPVRIAAVISNRADAAGLAAANDLGIPTVVIAPARFPDRAAYDVALAEAVRSHSPDLVVLAGFMRILGVPFVREFAGRLLNIHPSLLPAYRGLHTHQRVLEAGDRIHGCSVHFVTEELDGGPLIAQARLTVQPDDTPETLSARVQRLEHRIYPMVIGWFAADRLQWTDEAIRLDGRPLTEPFIMEAQT